MSPVRRTTSLVHLQSQRASASTSSLGMTMMSLTAIRMMFRLRAMLAKGATEDVTMPVIGSVAGKTMTAMSTDLNRV